MLTQQNSIQNDPRINKLQRRRAALEQQQQERGKDLEQANILDHQKISREIEFLIQDKPHIDKRNEKLRGLYEGLKVNSIKQIAQIKIGADKLTQSKQAIYEHLIRHKQKEAELFIALTQTEPKKLKVLIEENSSEGLYMREKEREIEELKIKNQILSDKVIQAANEQEYAREFQNNPHITQSLVRQMAQNEPPQHKNHNANSQMSIDTKNIMHHYIDLDQQSLVKGSKQSYDQLEF